MSLSIYRPSRVVDFRLGDNMRRLVSTMAIGK